MPLRWRLGLLVHKHPVLLGFTLAAMVCAALLAFVLLNQSRLSNQDQKIGKVVVDIQIDRRVTVGEVCKAINSVARNGNARNHLIERLVLEGGRQAGQLPRAKRIAARLERRRNPIVDCHAETRRIEDTLKRFTHALDHGASQHARRKLHHGRR